MAWREKQREKKKKKERKTEKPKSLIFQINEKQ